MSDTTLIIAVTEGLFKSLEKRIEALENKMNKNHHGNNGYTNGCRCQVCRDARKLSMRSYRAALKGKA